MLHYPWANNLLNMSITYTYYYASQVSYQGLDTTLNKPVRTLPNISIYVCKI